jgi:K(+)-stimulated pyrophosphate-energized sodium pump
MLFPLLIYAVGIVSSMISTSLVGQLVSNGGASGAMKAINRSFRLGALLSAIGMVLVGYSYLRFDGPYVVKQALERGLAKDGNVAEVLRAALPDQPMDDGPAVARAWSHLPREQQEKLAPSLLPTAQQIVPVREGNDFRPIIACLIGIALTLALMFCTEFWTSTEYSPVRSIAKSSRTGHATNIIQGIAVGYESTVWSVLLIAAAIFLGMFVFGDTHHPLFIAFGVSLAGIGMLTLTGDTLSMDVFGPVADNANGIGEMGYNRDSHNQPLPASHPDHLSREQYSSARQILADLDATGNTTKAITKGIAIGSAVVAAVSLFASFIAVLVKGSEEAINQLTRADFESKTGMLSVASPEVFIGMLIGGAVPFLFSSMTIRAVGRAAFLIVNGCRRQFQDKAIWEGTKKPDYDRVVDICTSTAQKELVGPGLLAICTPILVGFLLGPFALGGFLAGMIVVGQLLAVFMATAGGAWDNAKKMIEDQPKTPISGKGSATHKASVTGDTVGDPLKDTAGPAINPLIKVMNMVSLLALPLVILYNIKDGTDPNAFVAGTVITIGLLAVAWAWWQSKRDTAETRQIEAEYERELQQALSLAKGDSV